MHQIPISSFGLDFKDGHLTVTVDGQPFDMRLLQRVEVVLDAQLMIPFVRLTAVAGDTGVKLGNTTLEIKAGDPRKPTFGQPCIWPEDLGQGVREPRACGPAYHGDRGEDGAAPGHHEG